MGTEKNLRKLIAVLAAIVMLAAACGDDGGSSDSATPGDTSADDTGSDGTAPAGTTLNCAEVQAAIEAAGDLSTIDPTGNAGAEDLEASFNQSRAALQTIGTSAPEIAAEVEQALQGFDALGAIFAELNWETDFSSNPQAALELAGAMGEAEILGMIGAMSAISAWIAESCSS